MHVPEVIILIIFMIGLVNLVRYVYKGCRYIVKNTAGNESG